MIRAMLILLMTAAAALAVPATGTVYRTVMTDTNGVLVGASTNLAAANGLAGTASVAQVAANLVTASNVAVSAMSTGQAAQVSADAAMSTGMAAQATANASVATGTAHSATLLTKADLGGRVATTNYSVTVTGGTWDGSTAVLTSSGVVTIAAAQAVAGWGYAYLDSGAMGRVDQHWSGSAWETNAAGDLYADGITTVRVSAASGGAPQIEGGSNSLTISNLAVYAWQRATAGRTNDLGGTVVLVDAPADARSPATKSYVDAGLAGKAANASGWAQYDANGQPTPSGGVDLKGKALYLSSAYSILSLSSDGHFALQHNGRDVLSVTMSAMGCAISNAVIADTITLGVDTNGVASAPWPEYAADLMSGEWTAISNYTSTYPGETNGLYEITFTNSWTGGYFRVMQTGTNASELVSAVTFVAPDLRIDGTNASWRTMDVLAPDGSTNTIRYLGAP